MLDASVTRGLAAEPEEPSIGAENRDILLQFDPLASAEEKAAHEAWASSESHLKPSTPAALASSSTDTDSVPEIVARHSEPLEQPSMTPPDMPSSPAPTFPALAAIARTFSLPIGNRGQRPRSLEIATSVPSPATLSSFAQQQSAPATQTSMQDRAPGSGSASGRSTPGIRDAERDRRKPGERDNPPFDFQRFLEQMKQRSAEPVAKYLRSFLSNFAKRTFTVADQVKLINDFLEFISTRMRETDVWRNASDAEFDNAMEGMEKLVMNRLYEFTFTPQAARMVPPRPITVDDLERDRVLSQRVALFRWLEPKHLDVPEGDGAEGFLMFAQQELLKINHYKAPRDKLICILNCCKIIFGMLRHSRKEEGADTFVPVLIYIVLKASPPHLLSNVEFINRFRNPAKLQSEAGYYLSSLMGAVSFIETMDHTSLSNITQEEFEQNVESSVQSLSSSESETPESPTPPMVMSPSIPAGSLPSSHSGEESAQPLALSAPAQAFSEDARRFLQKTGDTFSKPLNALSRIFNEVLDNAEESLSSIPSPFTPIDPARNQQHRQQQIEQDHRLAQSLGLGVPQTPARAGEYSRQSSGYGPGMQTPYKPRVRRAPPSPHSSVRSASPYQQPPYGENTPVRHRGPGGPYTNQPLTMGPSQSTPTAQHTRPSSQDLRPPSAHVSRTPTPNLDLAGLQDEIDHAHERAAVAARDTLKQIFPTTDPEIMDWVLEANEGDLGKSIEALLEMNSGS
ncbi:hypothetical protein WOLCODRAFT_140322 [Wolfiporia cocos MD-104 SS10]|uniref:VPS9 domain-containing protein n=1 Tax=Wolfiporia cocos (strain MD-104) TaxID=742152 RepID=A0A2H3J287_WOLCO|nr:hypothetical protein WOLCODRAFT_140322 [Wolfiporia cocos MD-104 SS10]